MFRTLSILGLVFAGCGSAAADDPTSADRTFRYAISVGKQQPIYGEVTCRNYPCALFSSKTPNITVTLDKIAAGLIRPSISCENLNCFISFGPQNIDLRETDKLLKFTLAEGGMPGNNAVLLSARPMGEILIAF